MVWGNHSQKLVHFSWILLSIVITLALILAIVAPKIPRVYSVSCESYWTDEHERAHIHSRWCEDLPTYYPVRYTGYVCPSDAVTKRPEDVYPQVQFWRCELHDIYP